MFKIKRSRKILAVIIVIAVGVFFYTQNKSAQPVAQIQTTSVTTGSVISSVSASGLVLSSNFTPVTTLATGIVTQVYVKDGDHVIKGQKIATIELDIAGQKQHQADYASYLSAKNAVTSAQLGLYSAQSSSFAANQKFINDAVARDLSEDDPTYIQQYADWKAAEGKYNQQSLVIAQSQASATNSYLAYLASSPTITSPISGTITNITLAQGLQLSSGSQVAVIAGIGTPLASFNISEIDVAKLKIGQKATVTLDSISDKTFTGKVVSVDRIGTTSNGVTNYPTIIQFDTEASDVLPNMAATANIIIDSANNVLVVPNSAVTTSSGQSTVRLLNNGVEQIVTVETGLVSDTQTEIKSGLNEGDKVITGSVSTSGSTTIQSGGTSIFSSGFGGGAAAGGGTRNVQFIAR